MLFCYFDPQKKRGLRWAFFMIATFLSLRYMWGSDYPAYLSVYNDINGFGVSGIDLDNLDEFTGRHNEYGWYIVNRIAGILHLGFFGVVFFTTVFECWAVHRIIEKYVTPNYYWVAIFTWVFTAPSFCVYASMMRQYLSMCVYLLVIDLMIEKRVKYYFLKSALLIILAASFHRSALVMFLSLPLYYINVKITRSRLVLVFVIGCIFIVWRIFGRNLLEPLMMQVVSEADDFSSYMTYIGEDREGGIGTGLGMLFRYFMLGVWLYLLPVFEKNKQPIVILLIVSYFFEVLADFAPLAGRLSLYFEFISMICWALLVERAFKHHKWFLISLFAIEVAIIIKTIPEFFYAALWKSSFLHYQTIFSAPTWL